MDEKLKKNVSDYRNYMYLKVLKHLIYVSFKDKKGLNVYSWNDSFMNRVMKMYVQILVVIMLFGMCNFDIVLL